MPVTFGVDWYHHLPPHVTEILDTLRKAGHETYLVGGCVRDLWLELPPKDFDLVSSATPDEVEALFPRTEGVGRQFGIMIVVTESGVVEVARFRADAEYKDGRHPTGVTFSSPEEDAKRRDFTINALFYDPVKKQLIDYVGGIEDLKRKRLACVGDPAQRFEEDSLRMLRAVRFHAQLAEKGFELDPSLPSEIRPRSGRLSLVSRERVTQEMEKLFLSSRPSVGLFDLVLCGLWEPVFGIKPPNAAVYAQFDLLSETFLRIASQPAGFALFAAAVGRWIPGADLEKCFVLTREAKAALKAVPSLLQSFPRYISLERADKKYLLQNPHWTHAATLLHLEGSDDLLDVLDTAIDDHERWEKSGLLSPAPLLSGNDLIAAGAKPGPEIKTILDLVRREQLNENITTHDAALAFAKSRL